MTAARWEELPAGNRTKAGGYVLQDSRLQGATAYAGRFSSVQASAAYPKPEVVPYAVQPTPGKMAHYAALGIEEVVLQLPSEPEAEVLRVLDGFAQYL
ncbi:hypothetical protein [Streptomyces sp. NPDC060031]|uniref:hypothetical protein n=1 Tax=Streptomyces sp. NPDC060031 TaxID=3347043 RepID=UPI0036C63C6C